MIYLFILKNCFFLSCVDSDTIIYDILCTKYLYIYIFWRHNFYCDIFLCWLSCADSGRGHHYLIYLLFISRKMPCHSKLAIVGDSHCFRLTKQWMLALPPHITGVSVRAFGKPGAKLGGTTFCEDFFSPDLWVSTNSYLHMDRLQPSGAGSEEWV